MNVSGQFLDPGKSVMTREKKAKVMYSSEDLERFYLDYQSEWVRTRPLFRIVV